VSVSVITHRLLVAHINTLFNLIILKLNYHSNHRIPRAILTDEIIQDRLSKIVTTMTSDGFAFATDINGLWSLPITNCHFSHSTLHVTINVPLKRVNKEYKLYEVIKFPFQYKDSQCVVNDVTEYVAKVGRSIIPLTGITSKNCMPYDREYCYVPMNERDATPFTGCATALMSSKVRDIKEVSQVLYRTFQFFTTNWNLHV